LDFTAEKDRGTQCPDGCGGNPLKQQRLIDKTKESLRMKQRTSAKMLTVLLIGFFALGVTAFADDIKARMKSRLPVIKELKLQGIVGEDNAGFLQFVGDKKVSADVVAAENKDRQTVYQTIAKQQGTTAELVGKRRALQIAQRAEPGEWVQDAGGQWLQK
jgi:uncharacterized protein YdbL (DUF1318 family)